MQTGPASYPLLPIQARSLAQRREGSRHRHLSPSAVEIGDGVIESAFVQAIERWSRQDIFRLRIRDEHGEWRQYHRPLTGCSEVPIDEWTISDADDTDIAGRLTDICWQLGEGNDIVAGSPFQVGLVRVHGRLRYLLWVVDHVLIDNATFFVLLKRLRLAYEQIVARKPVSFPPDTALFRWSEHLARCATDPEVTREYGFWRTHWPARRRANAVRRIHTARRDGTRPSKARVLSALSEEETSAVYRFVVRRKIPFDELCLMSFLWAYKCQMGDARVRMCLLHNCRHSPLSRKVDLIEGCGWFVSMYPAVFDLSAADRHTFMRDFRRQYDRYADKRDHYGALRYLNADIGPRLATREDWSSTIVFNSLGEVIAASTGEDALRVTPLCLRVHAEFLRRVEQREDRPAAGGAPEHPRFACIGLVIDRRIHLVLQFDRHRHDESAMQALVGRAGASLVELANDALPCPAGCEL